MLAVVEVVEITHLSDQHLVAEVVVDIEAEIPIYLKWMLLLPLAAVVEEEEDLVEVQEVLVVPES
jgi:hypothetical protein